jgi:AAA15 family ATPase/GTPase
MLSKLRVQHYKSLFDTQVDLEPLTVFIGPNGSGKSNICEALAILSDFLQGLIDTGNNAVPIKDFFAQSLQAVSKNPLSIESKFWHGKLDYLFFEVSTLSKIDNNPSEKHENGSELSVHFDYPKQNVSIKIPENTIEKTDYIPRLRQILVSNEYPDSPLPMP